MNETKDKDEKKDEKKDNAKALKALKTEFTKEKKTLETDNKLKEKLNTIAAKIAQDTSSKDKDVHLHPDIKDACSKEKERVCWECAGINCYIKQQLCKRQNIKRQISWYLQGKEGNLW